MAEKKLQVKDLTISFRTNAGKVQAVRKIDFDLYKGETLAIVGESGSGKSVTSRAIMGILAGNAMVEGGKILYGDKDLMKITEEEFQQIRGDKIAMVFQDPLSSLNPIMRVGAQLTEAMLLKNKALRSESRKNIKRMFANLKKYMIASGVDTSVTEEMIAKFKKFELKHSALESEYTTALDYANEGAALCEHIRLTLEKGNKINISDDLKDLVVSAKNARSYFVIRDKANETTEIADTIKEDVVNGKKTGDYSVAIEKLNRLKAIFDEAAGFDVPNTFTLGYYLTFVNSEIPDMKVADLNALTRKKTDEEFMLKFLEAAQKGVEKSAADTEEARKKAIAFLQSKLPLFENPQEAQVKEAVKQMEEIVIACLDMLDVEKDSLTHTFASSMDNLTDLYFSGIGRNRAEEKRYARQKAKRDRIVARGKIPEWEVIPASYIDLDSVKQEMIDTIKEIIAHFEKQSLAVKTADYAARTVDVIDYLKKNAADSVNKLSKSAARERAIKLMEGVGIDEPRRRYRQYPFEFSGGMRQRIVIAIALTANPDVLICDEPTTALDVTIQAQILELINNLKKERELSVIFITHDLGVVANMADRIAVMYAGKIVEYGTSEDIFYNPAHPYTWALLSSVPDLDTKEKLESIPGTPPNMIYPPKGDAFADRNKYALDIDFEMQPPMFKVNDTHYAATWLLHPNAPKIEPPAVVTERINRMKNKREVKTNE